MAALRAMVMALCAAAVGGCSSPPREIAIPPVATMASDASAGASFVVAPSILSGFELADSPDDWRIGDQVLLGIRLNKPEGETVRLLHVELMDMVNQTPQIRFKATPVGRPVYWFESGLYFTKLSMYDEDGKLLQRAVGRFAKKLMGHGLFDGAAPLVGRPRLPNGDLDTSGLSDEEAERELLGWLSLYAFSMSMNKKGMFNEMMKDVVARPSLIAMLLNPSLSLSLGRDMQLEWHAWRPAGAEGMEVEGVTIPLTCAIANKVGAVARVHAARPVAPLGLTGGVVSIVGNNADKPEIKFEVRLLAAKRGTKGREFTPVVDDPVVE